jgi:hypothetical protein
MEAFADDGSVFHNNCADQRVGAGKAASALCQFNGALHIAFFIIGTAVRWIHGGHFLSKQGGKGGGRGRFHVQE